MSQDPGAARRFTQGRAVLSRLSKAEIGEKSYLHLETEMDYLTLDGAETARLADFLREQSSHPLIAERLQAIRLSAETGAPMRATGLTVLLETVLPLLPHTIAMQVQEITTLITTRTEKDQ